MKLAGSGGDGGGGGESFLPQGRGDVLIPTSFTESFYNGLLF